MAAADPKAVDLSMDVHDRVERLLADFDRDWADGRFATTVEQLPPVGHPLRASALNGLFRVEIVRQARNGGPGLEAYLALAGTGHARQRTGQSDPAGISGPHQGWGQSSAGGVRRPVPAPGRRAAPPPGGRRPRPGRRRGDPGAGVAPCPVAVLPVSVLARFLYFAARRQRHRRSGPAGTVRPLPHSQETGSRAAWERSTWRTTPSSTARSPSRCRRSPRQRRRRTSNASTARPAPPRPSPPEPLPALRRRRDQRHAVPDDGLHRRLAAGRTSSARTSCCPSSASPRSFAWSPRPSPRRTNAASSTAT